jgi:uncharacterized DUF497 family protein
MEKKNVSFEEIDAVVTNESLNVEKEDEANARNAEVIGEDLGNGLGCAQIIC